MAAVATCVTDAAVKVPVHSIPAKMDPWTIGREPASLWGGDIDGKYALYTVAELLCCSALFVLL